MSDLDDSDFKNACWMTRGCSGHGAPGDPQRFWGLCNTKLWDEYGKEKDSLVYSRVPPASVGQLTLCEDPKMQDTSKKFLFDSPNSLRSFGRNTLVTILKLHFSSNPDKFEYFQQTFTEPSEVINERKVSDDDNSKSNSDSESGDDDDDEEDNTSFLQTTLADLSGLAKAIKDESKDHLKILGTLTARLAEECSRPPPPTHFSVDTLCALCQDSPELIDVPKYRVEPQEEMDKAVDKFFTLCFGQYNLFHQRFVLNNFIPEPDVKKMFRAMYTQFQILNKKPELSLSEKEEAEALAALELEELRLKEQEQRLKEAKQRLLEKQKKPVQNRKSPPPSNTGSSSSETASSSSPIKTGSSSSKIPKKPKPIDELEFLNRHVANDDFGNLELKVHITGLAHSVATASTLSHFFDQFKTTMPDVTEKANLLTIIQKAIKQFKGRMKNDNTIVVEKAKLLAMDKISKRTGKDRVDKIALTRFLLCLPRKLTPF